MHFIRKSAGYPSTRLYDTFIAVKQAFQILFEDEQLLAVNKPAGYLSIPDRWDPDAPVLQRTLSAEFGRLFVVHRIDKDTTGVLLYARTSESHRRLNEQFSTREVEKNYLAIVHGEPLEDHWVVEHSLRANGDRMHRTVIDALKGKPAKTAFEVVERFRGFALVRAIPETGRTHQIRVHLASSNCAIVADTLYGDGSPLLLSSLKRKWKGDAFEEKPLIARSALHAMDLVFIHPTSEEKIKIEAPLPRDFEATLAQLRKNRSI